MTAPDLAAIQARAAVRVVAERIGGAE